MLQPFMAALPASIALIIFSDVTLAAEASAEPVIITATRTAQIADATLAPVIVITQADIQRTQATDVADLLRLHAGLDIGRNGGAGQVTSLFIRGTESNHVLVMVDGVKINPGSVGGAALQNISPAQIERIEVVKGPRSTLYGSDAIGGVINIITKRGTEGLHASAEASAGTYDTKHLAGGVHYADNVKAGITLSRLETDGFAPRSNSTLERGHDNTSFNTYLGGKLQGADIEFSHWQAQGNTEYLTFAPVDQDFLNSASAITATARPNALWASTVRVSRVLDKIDQNQSTDFAHTERHTLDWQNDMQFDEHQLFSAGVSLTREDVASMVYGTGFDERNFSRAVYLQDNLNLGDHQLLVAARHTRYDGFGAHTTADFEYGYRITPETRLIAAAGTAFRAPDQTDRFGYGGNPDLNPEISRNIELGVRQRLGTNQHLAVNIYSNHIDDLIDCTFDSVTYACPQKNVARARIRGIETQYNVRLDVWQINLELTAQDPKDLSNDLVLPRRAKRSATASVVYDQPAFQLGADLIAAGQRKDSNYSNDTMGGYGIVNINGALHLSKAWSIRGKVENLFDKHYELARDYNASGRALWIGASYQQ